MLLVSHDITVLFRLVEQDQGASNKSYTDSLFVCWQRLLVGRPKYSLCLLLAPRSANFSLEKIFFEDRYEATLSCSLALFELVQLLVYLNIA
jgi:hypothetical protein